MSTSGSRAGAALGAAIAAAVVAAQDQDRERFDELSAALRGPAAPHVDAILSAVVLDLLEQLHPDGLSGEDIADALTRCVASAAWSPDLEAGTLLIVLLGALGVAEAVPDDAPGEQSQDHAEDPIPDPPSDAALRRHALALVASLCSAVGEPPTGAIRAAIAEIERAETQEMP